MYRQIPASNKKNTYQNCFPMVHNEKAAIIRLRDVACEHAWAVRLIITHWDRTRPNSETSLFIVKKKHFPWVIFGFISILYKNIYTFIFVFLFLLCVTKICFMELES